MAKIWQYASLALVAAGPVYFEMSPGEFSAPILGLATLLVPYIIARYRMSHRELLRAILFASSAVLGIVSILTGFVNYLTDEFLTPQYVSILLQGRDWYSVPLITTYTRSGIVIQASVWNVYLPLLALFQLPFLPQYYRWFTLGIWGLLVYAMRKRYYASVAMAGQYPAVMAANGFNDVIPLLFLTLAYVTFTGSRSTAARYLSLGMKQFANTIIFLYYAFQRQWREAGVTVLVSAIYLLPFLVWDWRSAICTPILDMPPDCHNMNNLTFNSVHSLINFAVWPVWIIAVFYPALRTQVFQLSARLSHSLAREPTATRVRQLSHHFRFHHPWKTEKRDG
jgi:hypothetical protein